MTKDIAIIAAHLSFDEHGGSNYSIHRLASELTAQGDTVTVYTLNFADENHVPVDVEYSVERLELENRTPFDGAVKLYQRVGELARRHDLVHAYTPVVMPLLGRWRKHNPDADTPVVGTLNNYSLFCSNSSRMKDGCWKDCTLTKRIRHSRDGIGLITAARYVYMDVEVPRMLNEMDALYCLSPAVRDVYREIGVHDDVLCVIPNMIDPDFHNDTDDPTADVEPAVATDGGVD